jgi:hypothetical protein
LFSQFRISPQLYTKIYDSIVNKAKHIDQATKYTGLALAHGMQGDDYLSYFLNASNHEANTPLDMITYHHYAFPSYNDTKMHNYVFYSTQQFLDSVIRLEKIRKQLAPNTKVNIEEFGIIVGTGRETSPPPLPKEYWNMAAAQYGYAYAWLSNLGGVDALGMSQFVGYPGNFPSLPMIDGVDGKVNARYWALRIIIAHLGPDHGKRSVNVMYSASSQADNVYSTAFITRNTSGMKKKLLLVNKGIDAVNVHIDGINNGSIEYVDLRTGDKGVPKVERITGNMVTLGGFAVAVIILAH